MSPGVTAPAKRNPYVGPRPFRLGDRLYGRDRETRDVIVMLMAERILLLHAPSGAGKTSLLQASVIPGLKEEGFNVSEPLRVNAVPDNGVTPANRYIWSTIVGLAGNDAARSERYAAMTLSSYLKSEYDPRAEKEPYVLIFDQFEEIVTLDPGDRRRQAEFFEDVGAVLKNRNRWALFSMREDFMGGLAPFAARVPSHLKVRYRLDFLGHEAAMEATQRPAADEGVTFDADAAWGLIKRLAKIRRQLPGEQKATTVDGPYVEPVHLQAVCTELWRRLSEEWGDELQTILPKDVEMFGDVNAALAAYYSRSVTKVAKTTGASERAIRDWFEEKLMTEDGWFRNQTQTGPSVAGVDGEAVLKGLGDQYLIRSDQRGATMWYELAHDQLIEPICVDNAAWREANLGPYELAARDWDRGGRADLYLLSELRLARAKEWRVAKADSSQVLQDFIAASEERLHEEKRSRRRDDLLKGVGTVALIASVVALIEAVLIVVLITT